MKWLSYYLIIILLGATATVSGDEIVQEFKRPSFSGIGTSNDLIDESREDGIDNDGDWNIATDDVGIDGVAAIDSNNDGDYDDIGFVTKNEIIIDKEPILHIDDLIKSNMSWFKDYMDK